MPNLSISLLLCAASSLTLAHAEGLKTKKNLNEYVQDAMEQAFAELNLGAAEKKAFETEALPDASAFVSNYRQAGEGIDVQLEKDKLRNFLRFSASLFVGTVGGGAVAPKICVRVKAPASCASCTRLRAPLADVIEERLSRRGFTVRQGPAPAAESDLSGDAAYEEFATQATEASCDGVIYGELAPEQSSDTDDEEDEMKVSWNEYLALRDQAGKKVRAHVKTSPQIAQDLSAAAAVQAANQIIGRAHADLYPQAASRASSAPSRLADSGEERYVKLEGVTSYATYAKFKQVVTSSLPELKLEERFISPGVFQFQVDPGAQLEKVASQLAGLSWGGQALSVIKSSPEELEVTLK